MKIIILSVIAILLTSCENSNKKSALIGTWVTDRCDQAVSLSGEPLPKWSMGLYEFTNQGDIEFGRLTYNDSSCQDLDEERSPSKEANGVRSSFYISAILDYP